MSDVPKTPDYEKIAEIIEKLNAQHPPGKLQQDLNLAIKAIEALQDIVAAYYGPSCRKPTS